MVKYMASDVSVNLIINSVALIMNACLQKQGIFIPGRLATCTFAAGS
ncbi:MAG: hypothetical protein ACJAT7_003531 [Psychromonas sp.]|jgi:hypothetical protein